MDKKQRRKLQAKAHAKKHGMSYQAAHQQLFGNPNAEALEFWEWLDHVSDGPDCLTIADVLAMERGERVQLLVMDRNLCDHVYPRFGENHRPVAAAPDFFDPKRDGAVYVHGDGITGTMEWGWDEERERVDEPFTFEIEYAPRHWHPLNGDHLPTREEIGADFGLDGKELDEFIREELGKLPLGKTWREFPETTRMGWRGPAMRWELLSRQPPVFTKIDLEWFAMKTMMPLLREALGMEEGRIWLEREDGVWVLYVKELTLGEREFLSRRFADVVVRSRGRSTRSHICYEKHSARTGELLDMISTQEGRGDAITRFHEWREENAKWLGTFEEAVHDYFRGVVDEEPEDTRRTFEMIEWPDGERRTLEQVFGDVADAS